MTTQEHPGMSFPVPAKDNAGELPEPVSESLRSVMFSISELLPADITLDQFRAAMMLHFNGMRYLSDCSPDSIVTCTMKAATSGMMPGRDCHFLPFKDKKGNRHATFVADYQGLIRCLERTNKVRKAMAHPVYSNDHFVADYLADEFSHQPAKAQGKKSGELKCFYAAIIMKDGSRHVDIMDLEEMDRIKRRSPAHETGPWSSDFVEMGRKTVLKRLCKYVQVTPETAQVIEIEEEQAEENYNPDRGVQASIDLFGKEPEVVDHTMPSKDIGWGGSVKPKDETPRETLMRLLGEIEKQALDDDQKAEVHMWSNTLSHDESSEATLQRFSDLAGEMLAKLKGE